MIGLLEAWRPDVYRSAYGILGSSDDAEDVCQNVLIELSLRLGELREAAALAGFIRQVVLHQCFDFRRRRATRRGPAAFIGELDVAAEEAEIADRVALWEAIERLPPAEREALVRDIVAGHKHEEIAGEMKVSVATVRSRLQSAKRRLRGDLRSLQENRTMQTEPIIHQLIESAFPGATIESIEPEPGQWLPYYQRITLEAAGQRHVLDVRNEVDTEKARLLPHLHAAGILAPHLVAGPVQVAGTPWSLWKEPNGSNLTRWTMDGTYHRFRTATDIAFDALDQLRAFTGQAKAFGLSSETVQNRFAKVEDYQGPWARETVFCDALARLAPLVASAEGQLEYTCYLHFFPNYLQIKNGALGEIGYPFGRMEDPLFGLAMVWIYDCYPFVHTGFVEQYLLRHNVPRRDFALRLAIQSLVILVREVEVNAEGGGKTYGESLLGLLSLACSWL